MPREHAACLPLLNADLASPWAAQCWAMPLTSGGQLLCWHSTHALPHPLEPCPVHAACCSAERWAKRDLPGVQPLSCLHGVLGPHVEGRGCHLQQVHRVEPCTGSLLCTSMQPQAMHRLGCWYADRLQSTCQMEPWPTGCGTRAVQASWVHTAACSGQWVSRLDQLRTAVFSAFVYVGYEAWWSIAWLTHPPLTELHSIRVLRQGNAVQRDVPA